MQRQMRNVKRLLKNGLVLLAVCVNSIGCANGPKVEVCTLGSSALRCDYDEKAYKKSFEQGLNYICLSPSDYAKTLQACNSGGTAQVVACVISPDALVCDSRNLSFAESVNYVCMSAYYLTELMKYCKSGSVQTGL